MIQQLSYLVIICLIITVRTDKPCERWKDHKNFNLVHIEDDCGKVKVNASDTISSRILNGVTTSTSSLPWMAFVYLTHVGGNGHTFCGGSVINDRYILTAAHCVHEKFESITVTLGEDDFYKMQDPDVADIYTVESIVKNDGFFRPALLNDVALLRLDRSISFESPNIHYVCLPLSCEFAKRNFYGERVLIAGWGKGPTDTDVMKSLKKVESVVSKCDLNNKPLDISQLCTESLREKTCLGDSGGPLMYTPSQTTYQIGVLSGVHGECTDGGLMEMSYMRVTIFMDWILDSIKS